jgi:hypothetical protein
VPDEVAGADFGAEDGLVEVITFEADPSAAAAG